MVLGVPEEVTWMRELIGQNHNRLLSRAMVMSLHAHNIKTLEDILDGGQRDRFHQAMNAVGADNLHREQIHLAAQAQRRTRTESRLDRIRKQLPECGNLVGHFFASRGIVFKEYLNNCFECVGFKVRARDSDSGQPRFPDFVISLDDEDEGKEIVVECKSKDGYEEVDLTSATDVGGKAATHGLNHNPMITICQPYVSTNVPRQLKTASNLAVVNGEDLALALAALKLEKITLQRFKNWITTPEQPTIDDLFG